MYREMEERYRAMSQLGVRNIAGFNARLAEAKAVRRIVEEAKRYGNFVRMDMEGSDKTDATLRIFYELRAEFDNVGIVLQSYNYSFNDRFSDEEIDRGFQFAQALGVKVITASSTVSSAKRVAPFADKYKITVAMHGHSNLTDPNEFAKPESFAAALAMSKYFAINLDVGHFFAAGYDPVDYIQKNYKRITNLHLKDRKKDNGPNMVWGQGDTPIKPVLQLLKTKKYNIPANIEFEYRGDDTVAEVRKCFEYIKGALA